MNNIIYLYEDNGGQLYARKGDGLLVCDLEYANTTFASDAATWDDWAKDAINEQIEMEYGQPIVDTETCPLIAFYLCDTGSVVVDGNPGRAGEHYLRDVIDTDE